MANPQVDNGKFVRIANTVMEALCRAHLTRHEYAAVLAVIRKTWGWQKKKEKIALSELCELTGITDRAFMSGITTRLARKRVITKNQRPGKATEYGMNKDYEQWQTDMTVESGLNPLGDSTVEPGLNTPLSRDSTPMESGLNPRVRKSRSVKDTLIKTIKDKTVPPSAGMQRLVTLFIDGQTEQIGEKSVTKGGTIAGILKGPVKDFGEEEVERRMGHYFASTQAWIVERKHSIQIFRVKFNELRDGPLVDRAVRKDSEQPMDGHAAMLLAGINRREREARREPTG